MREAFPCEWEAVLPLLSPAMVGEIWPVKGRTQKWITNNTMHIVLEKAGSRGASGCLADDMRRPMDHKTQKTAPVEDSGERMETGTDRNWNRDPEKRTG